MTAVTLFDAGDHVADTVGEQSRSIAERFEAFHQGHPYEGSNVYVWQGHRKCRVCMLAASARYRARRKLRS